MNKNLPVLVGVVLGLLVGALLGYMLAPRDVARAKGNSADGAADSAGVQDPPANGSVKEGSKCSVRPDPKPADTTANNPSASLKDAIDGIKVQTPARGSGVISGKVALANGSPLPGVTLTANAHIPFDSKQDPSLEEEVRGVVTRRKLSENAKRSAKSDEQGHYSIEGIGDYTYWIAASLDGYKFEPTDHDAMYRSKAGATVDFVASPIFILTVEILLPTGGQPDEASVNYQKTASDGRMSGSGYTWESAKPTLELDPGTYRFTATSGEFEEFVAPAVTVDIGTGKATKVTLKLESKPSIVGKLTLPPDMGEDENIRVNVLKFEGAQAPSPEAVLSSRKYAWPEKHNGWTYKIGDLVAGNYVVAAVRDGKIAASATTVVSQGVVRVDLALASRNRADYVVVHVLAPDGSAVEGVSISAGYRMGSGSGTKGGNFRREKDGSYWVPHNEPERGERSEGNLSYFVEVFSAKYGTKEATYEKTAVSEVTVQFATPAFVTVTIVGYDTFEGKDRLRVQLRGGGEGQPGRRFTNSEPGENEGAKRRLGPVEPGSYEITLLLVESDRDFRPVIIAVEAVTLKAGEQEATISVPALYTVRVQLKETKSGRQVRLESERRNEARLSAETDDQGVATFKNVPAGTYEIRVDRKRMTLVVSANADVSFEPVDANAIRVEIKNTEGYAASLGLQTGDLIVAVNGTKFTSEAQMGGLLEGLADEKSVKFTVARGASEFEVEAEVQKLFKDRSAELKPVAR